MGVPPPKRPLVSGTNSKSTKNTSRSSNITEQLYERANNNNKSLSENNASISSNLSNAQTKHEDNQTISKDNEALNKMILQAHSSEFLEVFRILKKQKLKIKRTPETVKMFDQLRTSFVKVGLGEDFEEITKNTLVDEILNESLGLMGQEVESDVDAAVDEVLNFGSGSEVSFDNYEAKSNKVFGLGSYEKSGGDSDGQQQQSIFRIRNNEEPSNSKRTTFRNPTPPPSGPVPNNRPSSRTRQVREKPLSLEEILSKEPASSSLQTSESQASDKRVSSKKNVSIPISSLSIKDPMLSNMRSVVRKKVVKLVKKSCVGKPETGTDSDNGMPE